MMFTIDSKSHNFENIKRLYTWNEFKKQVSVTQEKHCGYNNFRILVIDSLLVMCIEMLFKDQNYSLYKGNIPIILSDKGNQHITIIYEMLGSLDTISDYDVTIYSIPPNKKIPLITHIIETIFYDIFQKGPGDVFDTNLYTHPLYIFKKEINSREKINSELLIPMGKQFNVFKLFINSGHQQFYKNELVYSNMMYYDYPNFYPNPNPKTYTNAVTHKVSVTGIKFKSNYLNISKEPSKTFTLATSPTKNYAKLQLIPHVGGGSKTLKKCVKGHPGKRM